RAVQRRSSLNARGLAATGIPGLDNVLAGGLTRNRTYVVQGDPGVGKTTLGLQFILAGIALGETGLYLTLSETKEEMKAVADSHGWSIDEIHVFEYSAHDRLAAEEESTLFHPSEVELGQAVQALLAEVERIKPKRV